MVYKAVGRQHVLPKATIERYYYKKQCVYIMRNGESDRAFPANADNNLFIANRQWDERAEKCVNDIEAKFQALSDRVIQGNSLDAQDFETANLFYAILSERSRARYHEFNDTASLFDKSTINYFYMPESEQDFNESEGVIFLRSENDNIIERVARGMPILQAIQRASSSSSKWGIFKTSKDFIVSDTYHYHAAIPVSPSFYLVKDRENGELSESETNDFNKAITEKSQKFVFSAREETLTSSLTRRSTGARL